MFPDPAEKLTQAFTLYRVSDKAFRTGPLKRLLYIEVSLEALCTPTHTLHTAEVVHPYHAGC